MSERAFEDEVIRAFQQPMARADREALVVPVLHRAAVLRRRRRLALAAAGASGAAITASALAALGTLPRAAEAVGGLVSALGAPGASAADPRIWVLLAAGVTLTMLAGLRGLGREF